MNYWEHVLYELDNCDDPNFTFLVTWFEEMHSKYQRERGKPAPESTKNNDQKKRKKLAPREQEIVKYIKKELSNYQIGVRLGITKRTVDSYIASIFDKLDINNRKALIKMEL